MNLTPESILWVIGIGASVSTIVFWGSFWMGQIVGGLKHAHQRLDEHDEVLGKLQSRRRDDNPRWEPGR